MLTKRKNGEAISIPGFVKPKVLENCQTTVPQAEKGKATVVVPLKRPDPVDKVAEGSCAKKSNAEGVYFSGNINQIVVVSSME